MQEPKAILKHYWGYDQFRPQQLAVIDAVLEGKDVLTLLPTGAGKSLCYQIPVLCKQGIGVIISPLIALMQDQVKDLAEKNIAAISMSSELDFYQLQAISKEVLAGKYQFIFCSPEKLAQKQFQAFLQKIPIQLFAIDEAHCISQWGYDFRPSYRKLDCIKSLFPTTPVLAMTASAIPAVQKDIVKQLQLTQAKVITTHFFRPNLSYQVKKVPVKLHSLKNLLGQTEGSVIIYCSTRNSVIQLTTLLKGYQFLVEAYHAGMPLEKRKSVQNAWMNNSIQIVVCTSAFGMGINKPDTRLVVHYDIPNSIEQYYQEAGRAGRDEKAACAILLYQQNDWEYWESLQDKMYPSIDTIKKVYQDLADYVQLPIGTGEQESFAFDFEQFCLHFNWDKIIARNALQWIAQEGHVRFSSASFKPSLVQVLAGRSQIEQFEKQHAIPGAVLQTLLRTYGGILDSPQMIQEQALAQILLRDSYFVQKQLQLLQEYGMILYQQKEQEPVVQFIWNRTAAAFMKLDFDNYNARKKAFQDRRDAFTNYLQHLGSTCRSAYLASYFGDTNHHQCGVCDNCMTTKE